MKRNQKLSQEKPPTPEQIAANYDKRRTELDEMLKEKSDKIREVLPKDLSVGRFLSACLSSLSKDIQILDCTNVSILSSILTCAQLGLFPDSFMGEAFFSLVKNGRKGVKECEVIIGYKGFCTLAYRSGFVKSIEARPVYNTDFFEHEFGLNEKCSHKPIARKPESYIVKFYAIIKLNNGGAIFDVMELQDVLEVRDNSINYQNAIDKALTAWNKYFADMGNKTVLRRLMKFSPLSPEIQRAVGIDEASEAGKQNTATDFMNFGEDFKKEAIEQVLEKNEEKKHIRRQSSVNNSRARGDLSMNETKKIMKEKEDGKS